MPDWLITYLGSLQGGIVRTLAAEMRAGGLGAAWLAFALGALHALTPGHGKAALAAYFLGREARVGKGVRIALTVALLHVLSGFAVFLVLRFILGQAHSITGQRLADARSGLAQRLPQLERGARILQGAGGVAIIAIGALTLSQLRL